MAALPHKHCENHPHREAVARCPSCGSDYCRECISEHEGRLLCAACLRARFTEVSGAKRSWGGLRRGAEAIFGLVLLWAVFYTAGRSLVATPTASHEYIFNNVASMLDVLDEEEP
ncbi:MAG: rhomboid family protein [Candidatus Hydrogenedentes bacterium]|nr:rhomboid family protein [Candidatus Hydrogenedentota bacterium]